jgi:hypothetical protein
MMHSIEITKVDTATINGFENVVCKIHYVLTWTNENGSTASENFRLLLVDPLDEKHWPDTSGLISYESLTEAQVKAWIEGSNTFDNLCLSLSQRAPIEPPVTENPTLPWVAA